MHYNYKFVNKEKFGLSDLVLIMEVLRGPDGCPWDREQTHQSIRKNLIEETYEVCEGIDTENYPLICEELGDLLLQVVFHAQMAKEEEQFDIEDVADGVCKKLIRRHPHIFGDVQANTSDQVLDNWDRIKRQEKGQTSTTEAMEHVFKGMPALMRAQKVQQRAAKVGFDWDDAEQTMKKLAEEQDELLQAIKGGNEAAVAEEAGDLLFSAVNVVRKCGQDSEEVLGQATDKFIGRFAVVEQLVSQDGLEWDMLSLSELDKYWERAKYGSKARE